MRELENRVTPDIRPPVLNSAEGPVPYLTLQGEWSLSELRQQWQQQATRRPIVLFDLSQLREAKLQEYQDYLHSLEQIPAENAAISEPVEVLPVEYVAPEPVLQTVAAPVLVEPAPALPVEAVPRSQPFAWPQLNLTLLTLTLPSFSLPQVTIPDIRLPELQLPTLHWPQLQVNWLETSSHFLLSVAVALTLLFGGPIVILETQSFVGKALQNWPFLENKPTYQTQETPAPEVTPDPIITSAEDVFSIKVPDLNISSTIVPNVDPNDSQQYTAALKQGIAHAKGTGLPDQLEHNKTIYLFAHSTDAPWNILRYNAQFYALKDAEVGQEIQIRFWGEDYTYRITEKKIIEAHDTSYLLPQTDVEQLVLQTCYPPGTAEKRLVVVAVPVEAE